MWSVWEISQSRPQQWGLALREEGLPKLRSESAPSPAVIAEGQEDSRIRHLSLGGLLKWSLTPDNEVHWRVNSVGQAHPLPDSQTVPDISIYWLQTTYCSLCCKLVYSLTPPPSTLAGRFLRLQNAVPVASSFPPVRHTLCFQAVTILSLISNLVWFAYVEVS